MSQGHWDDVVAAALVGVHSRPVGLDGAPALIADRLAGRDRDSTALVLDIAALTATAHAASAPPGVTAESVAPAPADDRPPISDVAAATVTRALDFSPAISEVCLRLLAASGRRPPPSLLPPLLARTARSVAFRPVIDTIVGPPGRWLAANAPQLGAVLPAVPARAGGAPEAVELPDRTVWEHGDLAARASFLGALRRADPAAARELLARSWKSEPGPERDAFIVVLRQRASMADEDFLEAALDDRRGAVRATAAEILDTLGESALQQRLFEAASAMLVVGRSRLGKTVITTAPPAALDPALRRDGVVAKAPAGIGPGAWIVQQVIGRIHPRRWESLWARTPAQIVAAVADGETALIAGLATATLAHRDRTWAEALLHRPGQPRPELIGLAGEDRIVARIRGLSGETARLALRALPRPWPEPVSRHAVELLRDELRNARQVTTGILQLTDLLSVGLPATEEWCRAIEELRSATDLAPGQLATLAEALRIRLVLTRELT
ncbi:MAG: DUF5691 domain-containing protein [Gordonia sp. (in: high G+C Gram-positive bacteria)]